MRRNHRVRLRTTCLSNILSFCSQNGRRFVPNAQTFREMEQSRGKEERACTTRSPAVRTHLASPRVRPCSSFETNPTRGPGVCRALSRDATDSSFLFFFFFARDDVAADCAMLACLSCTGFAGIECFLLVSSPTMAAGWEPGRGADGFRPALRSGGSPPL